jgi:hypothetical protein
MSYLDVKYIQLVSPQLQKFAKKKTDLYNFRCPYCGDSRKRQDKARGYFFRMKNEMIFKCHNCGTGKNLANFLKDNNVMLHDQYIMEKYKSNVKKRKVSVGDLEFETPVFKSTQIDIDLEKISELNTTHPAREYLTNRKIKDLDSFYYCPKFKQWTNTITKSIDNLNQDSPRIIIPLRDETGKLFGYQGRSLAPKAKIRYITIILDESKPKVYGLDKVNKEELVYVTEGPFDSTFIRNSIAMCGSDVELSNYNCQFVFVYDNEPRNREICAKIAKSIQKGDSVVIWPSSITEKDINDMVMTGHNVQSVVESNTYKGLEAQIRFNAWKKV